MDPLSLLLTAITVAILAPVYKLIFGIIDAIFDSGKKSESVTHYEQPQYIPTKESNYTRDWGNVARKYKKSQGYRCEVCRVDCSRDRHTRSLIHVHHRNLDSKNNAEWNLIALCVICHSEQPGAGHKRLAGAIQTDGRYSEVNQLRRNQGMFWL